MPQQKKTDKPSQQKDDTKTADLLHRLSKWLWAGLILGLLFAVAIFVIVSYTKMPDTQELENPDYEYASVIYADNNEELGRYFSKNREGITHEELNPYLTKALVATEDERFYKHSGVDTRGTIRAVIFLGSKGGASTISQQLAKLFFTNRSRNIIKRIWQKLKEWVIATQFEKRYTKEEIIAMYLNKVDFTYSSHGISAAAKTYFGKDQSKLKVHEAAVLVGMLKNPSLYNPKSKPENAVKRRNVVLKQMVRNNYLSQEEYTKLKDLPLDMSNFNRTILYEGIAPYFRETLKLHIKKILADDKYKKPDGTKYNPDVDGLKIYTTIDKKMQKHAEETMFQHMSVIQETYNGVWKGKDPWTHDADKKQAQQRKDFLNKSVRTSERYINTKNRVMAGVYQKIREKFSDARLLDADITRMTKAEKDPGYLNKLIKTDYISKKQASTYKDILADPLWKELKQSKKRLDDKAKKDFNLKRKMKVFAYNKEGEKSVVMSPLDSIRYHHKIMQLGSISIDPRNGHIKTWVGGVGNKYFKYDHVNSNRQVGSTFKPFLYASAISHGISPCHKIHDIRQEIPAGDPHFKLLETWSPGNSDGEFTDKWWTLKDGLKKSKNSISLGLLKEMKSVEPMRDLVSNLGIDKKKVPRVPSIILGAAQLTVLEMTAAYATFANYGVYHAPTFITKIEDKDGRVIYSSIPTERRVLSEKYNEVMLNLLQYASSAHTSKLKNSHWGGKTGTTNDFVDGWFMGVSPELVVGTWVGGEYNWIRFLSSYHGYGGIMARPFFLKYMQKLENDPSIRLNEDAYFRIPDGDRIVTDCNQYEQPSFHKDEVDKAKKIKDVLDGWEDEFGN